VEHLTLGKIKPRPKPLIDSGSLASFIAGIQKQDGEIPWSAGGKTDPWDHVESAMGLALAGRRREAERAYLWLAANQLADGSWYYAYQDGVPKDLTRDSNMATYPAVGVFHHFLLFADRTFVSNMWPTVSRGIDFALKMQGPCGEIYWARNPRGEIDPMALLTGSSSVYMSLKCAITLGYLLGKKMPSWREAYLRLGEAIRDNPSIFNMIKSRFSMDWYYPVLCGAVTGRQAWNRIARHWDKFVASGWGVRCVSDRPWVTLAETAELVLSLAAMEECDRGRELLSWIGEMKYDDGSYWMGVTFPDGVIWPEERTSWTAAAILMAHDAVEGLTPGSLLFRHDFWRALEATWEKGGLAATMEDWRLATGSPPPQVNRDGG
jgi:hypothetical protein